MDSGNSNHRPHTHAFAPFLSPPSLLLPHFHCILPRFCSSFLGAFVLLQLLLLCLILGCFPTTAVHALVWDRQSFVPTGLVGSMLALVEVKPHTLWANTARDAFSFPSPSSSSASSANATSYPYAPQSPNYTSIIVMIGRTNSNFQDPLKMYLMPWPLSSTASQQQRWVQAPMISSIPSPRNSFALISTANSYAPPPVAGRLFLHGGASSNDALAWRLHSLWTFDVESTTWTALGPSRMYGCEGRLSQAQNDIFIQYSSSTKGTVDECGYSSSALRQTDEFNCPWPTARSGHVMTTVGEYIFLYGGALTSSDIVGDVWRLKMDNHLDAAIQQQSTSSRGFYVYNSDQLKYLRNSSDPTIVQGNLCPVRWELITCEVNATSSLKNRPESDPFPPSRWLTSVTSSGSQLWVVSGREGFNEMSAHDDVWMLQTSNDDFKWFRITSSPDAVGRSFHATGALYIPNLSSNLPGIGAESAYTACANHSTVALVTSNGLAGNGQYLRDAWILIPSGCNQSLVAPQTSSYDAPHSVLLPDNSASLIWEWREINFTSLPTYGFTSANMQLPDGSFIFVCGQSTTSETNLMKVGSTIVDIPNRFAIDLPLPFTGASSLSAAAISAVEMLHIAAAKNSTVPNPLTPSARYMHFQMYVQSARKMIVYAGRGSADFSNLYNDMWQYNVDTVTWTKIGDADSARTAGTFWPPPYQNQAYVASESEGIFYMFGGSRVRSEGVSSAPCELELFRYEVATNTWTNLTSSFKSFTTWDEATQGAVSTATGEFHADGYVYPIGRCFSKLALLSNGTEMFVFGGKAKTSTSPSDNSLWKLNLITMGWQLVQKADPTASSDPGPVRVSTQQQPASRYMHSIAKISETEFIMGWGSVFSASDLGDLWIYSVTTGWRLVANYAHDPNTIRSRSLAPVAVRKVGVEIYLIVIGGYQPSPLVINDMYSFNARTYETTQLYPDNLAVTSNRDQAQIVTIHQDNSILLYGGSFSDPFVHELSLDECTVGAGRSPGRFVHDWLAILSLAPSLLLTIPRSFLDNGQQASTSKETLSVKITPQAFTSLPFALAFYQDSLLANASTYTILNTFDSLNSSSEGEVKAAFRTTQLLSMVTVTSNVTIVGLPNGKSVLGCSDHCNLNINLGSTFCNLGSFKAVSIKYLTLMNASSATLGGFLSISNSQVNLLNVSMSHNNGAFGGAISAVNSKMLITNCNFTDNAADKRGGAIYLVNTAINITRCTFSRNHIINASLTADAESGQGGAISAISSNVQILDSSFEGNSARVGGAISSLVMLVMVLPLPGMGLQTSVMDPWLSINGTRFDHNSASQDGGALYTSYLSAKSGLQAVSSASSVVSSSIFSHNAALGNGGAFYLDASRLVFNSTIFDSNRCNLGGGAIYWKPEVEDYYMQDPPVFYPSRQLSFPVSSGNGSCLNAMGDLQLMLDSNCNAASYGPFFASPAASLRIANESIEAASLRQAILAYISPIIVQLVDIYQQPVNVDNTTFISLGPTVGLSGVTTLQVIKGVATFDQVLLRISPNSELSLTFSSYPILPLLLQDEASAKAALSIRSSPTLTLGLAMTDSSNLFQVSSCALGCGLALPAPDDTRTTTLNLTLNLALFKHDWDQLFISIDQLSSSGINTKLVARFTGSDLINGNAVTTTDSGSDTVGTTTSPVSSSGSTSFGGTTSAGSATSSSASGSTTSAGSATSSSASGSTSSASIPASSSGTPASADSSAGSTPLSGNGSSVDSTTSSGTTVSAGSAASPGSTTFSNGGSSAGTSSASSATPSSASSGSTSSAGSTTSSDTSSPVDSSTSSDTTISAGSTTSSGSSSSAGSTVPPDNTSSSGSTSTSAGSTSSGSTIHSITSNNGLYSVTLVIPSGKVQVRLQTGDDLLGYLTGHVDFSSVAFCDEGLLFSTVDDQCVPIRESSFIARVIVIIAAVTAACLVCFSIFFVLRYRLSPHFRAASVAFSFTILGLLGCLCIASILFALLPDAGSNALCYARAWFATIPVTGILSILMVKAYKVSSIALNATASLRKTAAADSRMWSMVVIAILLQVGFCLAYILVPVTRSIFRFQTVNGSTIQYPVRECSTEDAFTPWFIVQMVYVGLIACVTGVYSFRTRRVHMQYNESSHVGISLILIVLIGVILIPVGIIVQNNPDAMVVVQGGGAAFLAIVLNFSLFFPKFSAVREMLRANRKLAAEKAKAEEQAKITAAQLFVVGPHQSHAVQNVVISDGSLSENLQKQKGFVDISGSAAAANQYFASSATPAMLASVQEEGEVAIPFDNSRPRDSLPPSSQPQSVPNPSASDSPSHSTFRPQSVIVFHVDSRESSQQEQTEEISVVVTSLTVHDERQQQHQQFQPNQHNSGTSTSHTVTPHPALVSTEGSNVETESDGMKRSDEDDQLKRNGFQMTN